MNHDKPVLKLYEKHAGTVIIAADTDPVRSGRCANFFLDRNQLPIDFLCIGLGANQQAMKTMGQFRDLILEKNIQLDAAFMPLRFSTDTIDPDTGEHKIKDCTVWRTVFFVQCQKDTKYETARSVSVVASPLEISGGEEQPPVSVG